MQLTVLEAFERVRNSVKPKDDSYTLRFSEAAPIGSIIRQGDIYIEKLEGLPDGFVKAKNQSARLVPGATRGSLHVLDSLDGVEIYEHPGANALTGPVVYAKTVRTVTHPEHGHVILPPGWYGVTYQRNHAEELRRALD